MTNVQIQYKPSIYHLEDGEFECEHVAGTHKEEVIGAYWNAEQENSIDFSDEVDVCSDCGDVL